MDVAEVQGISTREEFRSIRLGDRRLDKRFLRVVESLFDSPNCSINEAMGEWASAKAAYRLFDHEELTEERVLAAHRKPLKERVRGEKNILVVQDTSSLTYTSHTGTIGLGSVAFGPRGKSSQGLFMHTAYVLKEDGEPQGILDQVIWSRAENIAVEHEMWNENNCWLKCLRFGQELRGEGTEARLTYICDREGDFWDLMSEIERQKNFFIIRLVEQRCLKSTLKEWFAESPILSETIVEMEICRKTGESRYHQERKWEEITFCLQIVKMDLKRTSYNQDKSRVKGLEVYLVHALTLRNRREPEAPCTTLLSESEWKALYCRIHAAKQLPADPSSLNQATRWIAKLGGFLGRKHDGHPGMITIWRGWNKLTELTKLYDALGPPG